MRGDFRVTPAVSATTDSSTSCTWSSAGPAWSSLGEGNPARVRGLIDQERKRLTKVIGSADLRDFIIGNGEGQVPLSKLRMTLDALPRTLTRQGRERPRQAAQGAQSARPQLPKGAIPKNMRPPKGAFKAMRGGPR